MSKTSSCSLCPGQSHGLYNCPVFIEMTVSKCQAHVNSHHLCNNSLSSKHSTKECPSTKTCRECGWKHNTRLHRTSGTSRKSPVNSTGDTMVPVTSQSSALASAPATSAALLPTALADVSDGERVQHARLLMDTGASLSLITERLADALRVERRHHVKVSGLAGGLVSTTYVNLSFCSLPCLQADSSAAADSVSIQCLVVPDLVKFNVPSDPSRLLQIAPLVDKLLVEDPALGGNEIIDGV